jgi:CRISPR system Cascade subunit CasA
MSPPSFDLRTQPWIPVRRLDGSAAELPLREVLARSHECSSVRGELATTSLALVRLLLAVVHRALGVSQQPEQDWQDLWAQPTLPMADLDDYLDAFGDRFDLLSTDRPFLQVADLHTTRGGVSDLHPLIADVPNGIQFFTTRAGRGTAWLEFAEAARWLVHCQAYDPSGIKSGAVGDPRVKHGKGYPIGVAWAGTIGAVVVEGRTLRETLLLNLVGRSFNGDLLDECDTAAWERPPLTAAEQPRLPTGPADIYTWPSRRVRLVHDGERVVGVLVCNGDGLAPQNQFVEPMTAWRRSTPQEKALKSSIPVYMPRTHDPTRSLWRGLAALLPEQVARPAEGAPWLPPTVFRWLDQLRNAGALPADLALRTWAVGFAYGTNNSVVAELVDDALLVHAGLLGDQGQPVRAVALRAVTAADAAAAAIGHLAGNLAVAAGGDEARAQPNARELYYFALDAAFRRWLAGLRSDTDPLEAQRAWETFALRQAQVEEQRLLAAAGPTAWVGRVVSDRTGRRRVDAALASLWFRAALRKALPMAAFPAATSAQHEPEEVA